MNRIEFLRRELMHYFIIVTCVTLLMGVMGMVVDPSRQLGYEAYFSPLIFGFIGVVPSLAMYSKKELTRNQFFVRKGIQLLVLETLILAFVTGMNIVGREMMGAMAFSVALLFLAVHVMDWLIGFKRAHALTLDLKAYQDANL